MIFLDQERDFFETIETKKRPKSLNRDWESVESFWSQIRNDLNLISSFENLYQLAEQTDSVSDRQFVGMKAKLDPIINFSLEMLNLIPKRYF